MSTTSSGVREITILSEGQKSNACVLISLAVIKAFLSMSPKALSSDKKLKKRLAKAQQAGELMFDNFKDINKFGMPVSTAVQLFNHYLSKDKTEELKFDDSCAEELAERFCDARDSYDSYDTFTQFGGDLFLQVSDRYQGDDFFDVAQYIKKSALAQKLANVVAQTNQLPDLNNNQGYVITFGGHAVSLTHVNNKYYYYDSQTAILRESASFDAIQQVIINKIKSTGSVCKLDWISQPLLVNNNKVKKSINIEAKKPPSHNSTGSNVKRGMPQISLGSLSSSDTDSECGFNLSFNTSFNQQKTLLNEKLSTLKEIPTNGTVIDLDAMSQNQGGLTKIKKKKNNEKSSLVNKGASHNSMGIELNARLQNQGGVTKAKKKKNNEKSPFVNKCASQYYKSEWQSHCFFVVSSSKYKFEGDQLKADILKELSGEITSNTNEISDILTEYKDDLKILATKQGFTSRLFGWMIGYQTSSMRALQQYLSEQHSIDNPDVLINNALNGN